MLKKISQLALWTSETARLGSAPRPFDAIEAYVFYHPWAQLQSLVSTNNVTTNPTEGQISVSTTELASVN